MPRIEMTIHDTRINAQQAAQRFAQEAFGRDAEFHDDGTFGIADGTRRYSIVPVPRTGWRIESID